MKIPYNKINLLNKRFCKLLVIEEAPSYTTPGGTTRSQWKCLCDCGNIVIRRLDSLKKGTKCSCGCYLNSPRKDPQEMGITVVIGTYKSNAKKKNHVFELSRDEFTNLILSNCHYCNCIPSAINRVRTGYAKVIYNGVDRKDNNLGYTIDNCVTCCKSCNYLKGAMGYDEFLNKIKTIFTNRFKTNA